MHNPVYHVLLDGRRVGPYDRRTIVGMRVKKALDSKQVLVGADGVRVTVGELLRGEPPPDFAASDNSRAGSSYSVVQGIHAARVLEVERGPVTVPLFKGEVEVRVQTRVLRISGRYREGLAWKEERVKIPLEDIVHARLQGSVVDLWLRTAGQDGKQRISLDLLKRENAGDLAESLPHAAPWPGSEPLAARPQRGAALMPFMWAAIVASALLVGGLLVWVLLHR
ncbi:MAG TPA: hypothetical protein VHL79_20400 [Ramlibacter sp.]|nr:hypothetical protein [Ramlibacter sp.]